MRYLIGLILGMFALTVFNPTVLEAKHHKKHHNGDKKQKKQQKKEKKKQKKEEKKKKKEEKKQRKKQEKQREKESRKQEEQKERELEAKRRQWCEEMGVSYESQFGRGSESSTSSDHNNPRDMSAWEMQQAEQERDNRGPLGSDNR